jgi:hypothetical protein
MAVLTLSEVNFAADSSYRSDARSYESFDRYAERRLSEQGAAVKSLSRFDVFLSHSFTDRKTILGLRTLLESAGLSVYVDWIDDPQLDRNNVSSATAAVLKARMAQSRSLLYASSPGASRSRWMPWELGHFDGLKGRVGVLPVDTGTSRSTTYAGQEYLSLYPYIGPCSSYAAASDLCVFEGTS